MPTDRDMKIAEAVRNAVMLSLASIDFNGPNETKSLWETVNIKWNFIDLRAVIEKVDNGRT
jgi:hypothetical protein